MVELSCHGGWLIPQLVVDACEQLGTRRAEPGEFTRRAYLRGKLDLIQAEAIADLIHARSRALHRAALVQMERGLSRRVSDLRERLIRLEALLAHPWPGNVRELDHAVERAVLMARGETVRSADMSLRTGGDGIPSLEDMSLEEVECFLIKKALGRFAGNVSQAAQALGLSRSALYRRLQRYGL